MKGVSQTGRSTCYFCGSEGPIETHHIVPRRHDGGDEDENLVDLCPTCHERLERLYTDETFEQIRARGGDTDTQPDVSISKNESAVVAFRIIEDYPGGFNLPGNVSSSGLPDQERALYRLKTLGMNEASATDILETASRTKHIAEINAEGNIYYDTTEGFYDQYEDIIPNSLSRYCYECSRSALSYYIEGEDSSEPVCLNCDNLLREQYKRAANASQNEAGQREAIQSVRGVVAELEKREGEGAPFNEIISKAKKETGQSDIYIKHELRKLRGRGELYMPHKGYLRTT